MVTLTTKIPSKPPPVCIEGGEAHKIPFKGCSCPDDFQLDESHPQFAGKPCCKCIHVPTTLPPKFTAQMPTTKPKPVCIYGEETHSIPFTGCKCPEGFEIDTTHKQEHGEDCCACNPLPTTAPVITTTSPTHAPICIESGSKHTIPYMNCRCPEGFKVDQSYLQVDGESCCKCDHIPTTQPSTLTTKIPSKPPPVCIEGGKAHKIPFKGCTCPDDFQIDESHPQVAGKLCCKCVHVPTTLPPKVTTQVSTTKPKPVCIYGEETYSIPFTGCKCPEGFEIDNKK